MESFETALEAAKAGDFDRAFSIWLPLAESGNPFAQINIGYLYAKGLSAPNDQFEADRWFEKASQSSEPAVQEALRLAYSMMETESYFELNKGFG